MREGDSPHTSGKHNMRFLHPTACVNGFGTMKQIQYLRKQGAGGRREPRQEPWAAAPASLALVNVETDLPLDSKARTEKTQNDGIQVSVFW